jgi:hypothetical protein
MAEINGFNYVFRHADAEVGAIKRFTEKFITKTKEAMESVNESVRVGLLTQEEASPSWYRFVDDIPMNSRLASWCEDLRAVNRRVKFGVRQTGMHFSFGAGNLKVLNEVWMYLPEQPYAQMRLGYRDYFTTQVGGGSERYGIYTRLIQNGKYNTDNEQHCMSLTEKFDRAIVNAKKYMRPYTPQELVRIKLGDFANNVANETNTFNGEASGADSAVRTHDALLPELAYLIDSGHEFRSGQLREAVVSWMAKHKAAQEHRSRARHAWFVHVYERFDKQYFDVIEMFDVHKRNNPSIQSSRTYTADDMPEEIMGKLSVLTMVDIGHRVSDVGMRATETTFYVERV